MLLRAIDLVVRRHPSQPPAVDHVSIDVSAGELVAIVGPNGSGKSTLGRALAGLVAIESGSVAGAQHRPPRVGLVLQDPAAQLIELTVADDVALGPQHAGLAPLEVSARVEHEVGAAHVAHLWHRDPAALSGGQQQRVAVAAIAACEVDVLVLDEPTALLDEPARRDFAARVRELAHGRGVLWITQEPDEVAACDRVVVLDAGAVAWQGGIDAWLADPAIAATWGLELPAAARIAHELARRGVHLPSGDQPRTVDELFARIAEVAGG